jgi:hypothetical protein
MEMATPTKTVTYTLRNTFSNVDISNHRTIEAAVKAQIKHLRGVKRMHGGSSYLTYTVLCNGVELNEQEREEYVELCFATR